MAYLCVRNLPPFANNECLKALLGERTAFLSRVKWGHYRLNGSEYARADITLPDEMLQEIFGMFNGVEILGNKVSVHIPKKEGQKQYGEIEPIQKNHKIDRPREKTSTSPSIIQNLVSDDSNRTDACKHCGSTEHFSRKCPRKASS